MTFPLAPISGIIPIQSINRARRLTMHLSLPGALEEWVEAQSRTGQFSDAADYIRDLIRRDQARAQKIAQMQQLVTEALDSGISPQSMSDIEQSVKIAL